MIKLYLHVDICVAEARGMSVLFFHNSAEFGRIFHTMHFFVTTFFAMRNKQLLFYSAKHIDDFHV